MAIPFDHFGGLVTKPGVDEPLINSTSRAVAGKGMAENMEATDDRPPTPFEGAVEMVVRLVDGDGNGSRSSLLAPWNPLPWRDGECPARVLVDPRAHDLGEER